MTTGEANSTVFGESSPFVETGAADADSLGFSSRDHLGRRDVWKSVPDEWGTNPNQSDDFVVSAAETDSPGLSWHARQERRDAWQKIHDMLVEWGADPNQLEDEGIIPPNRTIIRHACYVAQRLRDGEIAPPACVVPNGDGGILFEWDGPELSSTIEVLSDGSIEYTDYLNNKVHTLEVVERFEVE